MAQGGMIGLESQSCGEMVGLTGWENQSCGAGGGLSVWLVLLAAREVLLLLRLQERVAEGNLRCASNTGRSVHEPAGISQGNMHRSI